MKSAIKTACLILALMLLIPAAALADETGDAIEQGLAFYKKGKLTKAIGELEFALAQMRQQKAEAIQKLLPQPPEGWKSEPGRSSSAGAGFMGGGVSATSNYRQVNGRGRVQIQVISDSPMIGAMAAMLQNPAFAQSSQGAKLTRFQGLKAIITSKSPKRAELQTLINNKMLFKVSANQVEEAAKLVKEFGMLVDMDKLSEFAR